MSCTTHDEHSHKHSSDCVHKTIKHDDHVDYLHDGCMHHVHGDHVDEHKIAESATNAASCTPDHACGSHEAEHKHGADCGHEAVPHGDHVDYLVNGHLHSPCGTHCDHHGAVSST